MEKILLKKTLELEYWVKQIDLTKFNIEDDGIIIVAEEYAYTPAQFRFHIDPLVKAYIRGEYPWLKMKIEISGSDTGLKYIALYNPNKYKSNILGRIYTYLLNLFK